MPARGVYGAGDVYGVNPDTPVIGSVYDTFGMAAKGFAKSPLGKASAQTFERATDAGANRTRDVGMGIAIGVAAVVVLLIVTRR